MISRIYEEGSGMVLLSNNKTCKVLGPGFVSIWMFDDYIKTLQGVWFGQKPKRNIEC